ncbi:MAG TPA: hypothetical protein VGR74_13010 [Actinomycetota bacterium]|nr:hypothetical protein [Actinomycetota bacterium]
MCLLVEERGDLWQWHERLHGGLDIVAGGDVQEAGDPGRAALGVQVQEAGQLRLGGFDQVRPGLEQAAVALASKIMAEKTTSRSP